MEHKKPKFQMKIGKGRFSWGWVCSSFIHKIIQILKEEEIPYVDKLIRTIAGERAAEITKYKNR